jgi:hypothetical protein
MENKKTAVLSVSWEKQEKNIGKRAEKRYHSR